MRAQVRSMMMLVMAHEHYLRLTLRRRRRPTGRVRTEARVHRLDRACRRCRALSSTLLRSTRQCQAQIRKLLREVR
jgi:hypothetical protein